MEFADSSWRKVLKSEKKISPRLKGLKMVLKKSFPIWKFFPWFWLKTPYFSLISLTGKSLQNFPDFLDQLEPIVQCHGSCSLCHGLRGYNLKLIKFKMLLLTPILRKDFYCVVFVIFFLESNFPWFIQNSPLFADFLVKFLFVMAFPWLEKNLSFFLHFPVPVETHFWLTFLHGKYHSL